jgi:hypothetical protein
VKSNQIGFLRPIWEVTSGSGFSPASIRRKGPITWLSIAMLTDQILFRLYPKLANVLRSGTQTAPPRTGVDN